MHPDYAPPPIRIHIYRTTAGFVSPSPMGYVNAATAYDGDIERAIAAFTREAKLDEGTYVAKWGGAGICGRAEYVFSVRVETATTHHVEVAP